MLYLFIIQYKSLQGRFDIKNIGHTKIYQSLLIKISRGKQHSYSGRRIYDTSTLPRTNKGDTNQQPVLKMRRTQLNYNEATDAAF